jgi:hypothetical protein
MRVPLGYVNVNRKPKSVSLLLMKGIVPLKLKYIGTWKVYGCGGIGVFQSH